MALEPGKIRNVAVVGHRGTGKTSLVEALLFQAGATNRLGTVESGSTVSDWDDDEQRRQMSLSASICNVEWQGRKINLIDTPGDAGFQGDAIAALRVVEGALFTVSAVMGVEVQTSRHWQRAEEAGLSRVIVVNMLDRERADFYRVLEALRSQLSDKCVAVHIPIGVEHELKGIVDLLHMQAYMDPNGQREGGPVDIPAEVQAEVQEYREKLLDAVVETDEGLMERYLEGQELSPEEVAKALKDAVTRGEVFPVACGVASKNLGTTAVLDLLVEGVPSPARKGAPISVDGAETAAFVFKTIADPFAGRINVFRVLNGTLKGDSTIVNARSHAKERLGQLMQLEGKEHVQVTEFGEGDIGAVAKLKETQTGDVLMDAEHQVELPQIGFPEPVMSFAVTPKAKGDEEKMAAGLRRLSEEDPTIQMRRDQQTGEQLLTGLSQMHVEVAVDRLKSRFNVEVELHQPRVPYLETIRKESRAQGRYKKQTGGRGQFGDCVIQLEPLDGLDRALELWWFFFGPVIGHLLSKAVAGEENQISPMLREYLSNAISGKPITLDSFIEACAERDLLRARILRQMQEVPILLSPVSSGPAFLHGEGNYRPGTGYLDTMRHSQWLNLTGFPGASVPLTLSSEGLPIGVQIIGRPFEDELVLSVAEALEAMCGKWQPPSLEVS
ncbi:MAG: elongation factor G [Candidatus Acidiferrum sp.]